MAPAGAPEGGSVRRLIVIQRWGVSSSGRPSSVWWIAQMRSTVYGGRIRYSVES